VIGVAGGSLVRVRKGRRYGVGPRSAHIGGFPYACYLPAARFDGAVAELVAPRPDDPADHVVIRLADGGQAAITNTCAAIALGVVEPGDHAATGADADAAIAAFAAAGRLVGLDSRTLAERVLRTSAEAVGALALGVAAEFDLARPTIVAVGGGAGGLGRHVASVLGLECVVPELAEVISAVGDALSLVRVERERSVPKGGPADQIVDGAELAASAEAGCIDAGADPASIDIRVELDPDGTTLRAIATGMVGLESGALPGRAPIDASQAAALIAAAGVGAGGAEPVGRYWVASDAGGGGDLVTTVVLDRVGDAVATGTGGLVWIDAVDAAGRADQAAAAVSLVARCTRKRGPVVVAPVAWLVQGNRAQQVPPDLLGAACEDLPTDLGPAAAVVLQG
jgi:hypothetical protein